MDRLPRELLTMIGNECDLADLRRLSLCSWRMYSALISLFYWSSVKDNERLCERIISTFRYDVDENAIISAFRYDVDENAIIRALERAQQAGAGLESWEQVTIPGFRPRTNNGMLCRIPAYRYEQCENTLLGSAAFQGLQDVVSFLHRTGISIDAVGNPSPELPTPLFVALAKEKPKVAVRLLDLGASPIPYENARTALHLAAATDQSSIVTRLVQEVGVNADVRDENGDSPLVYVVTSSRATRGMISLLAYLGANVNQMTTLGGQSISLLNLACVLRRWDLAEQLLVCGADAEGGRNVTNDDSTHKGPSRLLEIACMSRGHDEERRTFITRLIEHGADLNLRTRDGRPLLVDLISAGHNWEAESLTRCSRLEQPDSEGMMAIGYALHTRYGSPALAKILLEKGSHLPDDCLKNIIRVVRLYKANKNRRKKLLAKHPRLKDICNVLFDHYTRHPSGDKDRARRDVLSSVAKVRGGVGKTPGCPKRAEHGSP